MGSCNLHFVAATDNVIKLTKIESFSSRLLFRIFRLALRLRDAKPYTHSLGSRLSVANHSAFHVCLQPAVQSWWNEILHWNRRVKTNATAQLNESVCCNDHGDLRTSVLGSNKASYHGITKPFIIRAFWLGACVIPYYTVKRCHDYFELDLGSDWKRIQAGRRLVRSLVTIYDIDVSMFTCI